MVSPEQRATTKPRTLEEIAYDIWVRDSRGEFLSEEQILAALREAADAARQEEREALRAEVVVLQTLADDEPETNGFESACRQFLGRIDARSGKSLKRSDAPRYADQSKVANSPLNDLTRSSAGEQE